LNFNSLTYQQKNKALVIVGILLFIICYLFAFRNTIELYNKNKQAEQKLTSLENAPQQIAGLNTRLTFLNSRVKQYVRDNDFEQEDVLVEISNFCKENKLKIVEFPKSTLKRKEDIVIETFTFKVEGNFTNLVKLIYDIEVVQKIGRVAALDFKSQIDKRTKIKRLTVEIFLQNLRNNEY